MGGARTAATPAPASEITRDVLRATCAPRTSPPHDPQLHRRGPPVHRLRRWARRAHRRRRHSPRARRGLHRGCPCPLEALYRADPLPRPAAVVHVAGRRRGDRRVPDGADATPTLGETPVPVIRDAHLWALLEACAARSFDDRRDTAILRLFMNTGARLSEVAEFGLDDVDLDHGEVWVRRKGARDQVLPVGAKTIRRWTATCGPAAATARPPWRICGWARTARSPTPASRRWCAAAAATRTSSRSTSTGTATPGRTR